MPAGVARPKVTQRKQHSYKGEIEAMHAEYTDCTSDQRLCQPSITFTIVYVLAGTGKPLVNHSSTLAVKCLTLIFFFHNRFICRNFKPWVDPRWGPFLPSVFTYYKTRAELYYCPGSGKGVQQQRLWASRWSFAAQLWAMMCVTLEHGRGSSADCLSGCT